MKDPIVERVCHKLRYRSQVGINKYGTTLQDSSQTTLEFLVHAQEEALDLANYLEVLIEREKGVQLAKAFLGQLTND